MLLMVVCVNISITQVKNPGRNIPLSNMILVPVLIAELVLPAALSLGLDASQDHYVTGQYTKLAAQVAGQWLKVLFSVAAVVSLIGACNSAVIVSDESLQSFCIRNRPKFFVRQAASNSRMMRWLFDTDGRIAPFFVLLNGGILVCNDSM